MVRPCEGRDYLYMATVLANRCSLTVIHFGINGTKPATPWPMEPCHSGAVAPNALLELEKFPPYLTYPPESIRAVSVALTFGDVTVTAMDYDRAEILQP